MLGHFNIDIKAETPNENHLLEFGERNEQDSTYFSEYSLCIVSILASYSSRNDVTLAFR